MMENFKPVVLDCETNIRNQSVGNNKASPFYKDNGVVLGMFYSSNGMGHIKPYTTDNIIFGDSVSRKISDEVVQFALENYNVIVGHNIKFDLLYLRKFYNKLYLDWLKRGGTVWDTQVVEYLLSGQTHLYPSLDQVAERYGGTLKDEKIKEYWNNGIDTSEIPYGELWNYLHDDCKNTEIVFWAQAELVDKLDMYALVTTQMDALLALVEMEHNGAFFNYSGAMRAADKMNDSLQLIEDKIEATMQDMLPMNMKHKLTPASPQQLSAVLFGGNVRVVENVPMLDASGVPIKYKSGINKGKVRTKKQESLVRIDGFKLEPLVDSKSKAGYYSTDDEHLTKLLGCTTSTPASDDFINLLLSFRSISKELSTYYYGYTQLTWDDGLIHTNYNQCATGTGRLSSNGPNLQNLSNKDRE